jgi:hypothetical protein
MRPRGGAHAAERWDQETSVVIPVDRGHGPGARCGQFGGSSVVGQAGEIRVSARERQAACFARVRVGRVVEVRVRRLADLADVESLNACIVAAIRLAGPGAVICADHRLASPLPSDVADASSHAMRKANSGIARSGLLLDPANTMFNLQVERIVRCAGSPARRLFTDSRELCDWVDDALTEPERVELRTFLSGKE